MQPLNGKKRVLVTGGAKHLGAAICLALAGSGYDLAIHYYQSRDEAFAIAEQCRERGVDAQCIQGDFETGDSLKDFIQRYKERFSHTYALINNVGNYLVKSASESSLEEWAAIFQNNLHAPFYLSQSLIPDLLVAKGAIINLGTAGLLRFNANTYATAYYLAKNALYLLTKSLAKELASRSVRVNMVSPGHLEHSADLKDANQLPLKRPASYSEITRVITFLLAPENSYITGQNIEVAGGYAL